MKPPLVAAICAVAVVAAFLVGRATSGAESPADAPSHGDDSVRLAREVEDLKRKLDEERTHRPRGEGGRARAREETPQADEASVESAPAAAPEANAAADAGPAAFSLEGVTSAADASKKFMAFAEAQLARGDAGFAAILQALDGVFKEKEKMQALFADEASAARELYPWVKFLVSHEAQVTDLNEYVFRTMAENPAAFASTSSPKSLEMFTEGLSFLMPGAVPEERLARLRGYAEKIMATPESSQPEAIRGNRSEIERLLSRFWMAPITAEQALEKLKAGDVPARDIVRYLRMVPPEAAALLDVTALVLPHLKQGNYDMLRWLGAPPLDHLDFSRLDPAVLEGIDAGKANWSQLATYVQRSGRKQWADLRPLFDRALAQGERTSAAALQVLGSGMLQPSMRPDRAYVESLLTRSDIPEATQKQLKAAYGIQ
jgi:hypothetical protein